MIHTDHFGYLGESFVADFGIGLISFLAAILGFGLCMVGGMAFNRGQQPLRVALMAVEVVAWIAVALASSVLETIARTGLFMQAVDDKIPRNFERHLEGK